jgi:integrase
VAAPGLILPDLADHLATYTAPDLDALVFTSPQGSPLRHGNFQRRAWLPALKVAGLHRFHFHDLRGTGNTFTANRGANPRELMTRMGHSTPRAALIYLHSDPRQRSIADAVDKAARTELRRARRRPAGTSGTELARSDEDGS